MKYIIPILICSLILTLILWLNAADTLYFLLACVHDNKVRLELCEPIDELSAVILWLQFDRGGGSIEYDSCNSVVK